MNKRKFTQEEKTIWLRGKIAGYYAAKARERRRQKKQVRYGEFDVNEAFERALERTYGKDFKK